MNNTLAPLLDPDVARPSWHQTFVERVAPYNLTRSVIWKKDPHLERVNLPQRLYRYSSYKHEYLTMALTGDLHLSLPSNVNDPGDMYANIDVSNLLNIFASVINCNNCYEAFEKITHPAFSYDGPFALYSLFRDIQRYWHQAIKPPPAMVTEQNISIFNKLFKKIFKLSMRYASFSETHDDLAMWAYYAENHNGYCLEYEVDDSAMEIKIYSGAYSILMPVIYDTHLFDGNRYIQEAIKADLHEKNNALLFMLLLNSTLCMQKHVSWAQEKEWRLIVTTQNYTGDPVPNHASPFRLVGVHTGLRMPKQSKDEIHNSLSGTGINFYEIGADHHTFNLFSTRDKSANDLMFDPYPGMI